MPRSVRMLVAAVTAATTAQLPLLVAAPAPAAAAAGDVTVLAGNGNGYGGPATAAYLGQAVRVAVAPDGAVLLADAGRVLRIPPGTDRIDVVAAGLDGPVDVAAGATGTVYVAETARVSRIEPDGTLTPVAGTGTAGKPVPEGAPDARTVPMRPHGIDVTSDGRVLVSEGTQVRVVEPDGRLTHLAGAYGVSQAYGADGPGATARFGFVPDLVAGADGEAFAADRTGGRVRRIDTATGAVTTVAGTRTGADAADGVPATSAYLDEPLAVAYVATDGAVLVADQAAGGRIRRFAIGGTITTPLPSTPCGTSMAVTPDGALVAACWGFPGGPATSPHSHLVFRLLDGEPVRLAGTTASTSPGGVPAAQSRVGNTTGVTGDGAGTVWLASSTDDVVRRIGPDGTQTVVAGGGTELGDGGPATAALLADPTHLALGPDGSLYVADTGAHRIRRVAPDGTISTVAGDGTTTYPGDGPDATAVGLAAPADVEVAPDGTLYVADTGHDAVRRVAPDGSVSTYAGGGAPAAGTGDGGPATAAVLERPTDLALLPGGGLAIAEGRLRRVGADGTIESVFPHAATQTRLVAALPDGSLAVLTGSGLQRLLPDGALAAAGRLAAPAATALGIAGADLLVARGAVGDVVAVDVSGDPPPVPGPVADLVATPGPARITLTYAQPAVGSVEVRISRGTVPPANVHDGRPPARYAAPVSTSPGTTSTYVVFAETTAAALEPGRPYAVSVFVQSWYPIGPSSVQSTWSRAASAVVTPLADDQPPAPVADPRTVAHHSYVQLRWVPPADDDLSRVVLRMAEGDVPPAGPEDGTDVAHGGTLATVFGLSPGVRYSFALFALDHSGNASTPYTVTTELDRTGPGPVTDVAVDAANTLARVGWTPPADADYRWARVAFQAGAEPPAAPDGGTIGVDSVSLWGVAVGQAYTGRIWPEDDKGNLGEPVTFSFTPVDTQAPAAVGGLVATPLDGGRVTLRWTNPAADLHHVVVRMATGGTPPATPASGTAVYSGTGTTVTRTGLANGVTYSFSVFAADAAGNTSPARSWTGLGTTLAFAASPRALTYGQVTALTATLRHGTQPMPGYRVTFHQRRLGTTAWVPIATGTTSHTGAVTFRHRPVAGAHYQVRWAGYAGLLGSASGPVGVSVAPAVTVAPSAPVVPLGATVRFTTTVAPGHPGQPVVLQRLVSGRWVDAVRLPLSSSSSAVFAVRPASRGTWTYRVIRPADVDHAAGASRAVSVAVR